MVLLCQMDFVWGGFMHLLTCRGWLYIPQTRHVEDGFIVSDGFTHILARKGWFCV